MWLSNNDKQWIKTKYPNFQFSENQGVQEVTGLLYFCMSYDKHDRRQAILTNGNYEKGIVICDAYNIEIVFTKSDHLPRVREIGGRLEKVKHQKKIVDISDLHVSKEGWGGKKGWACLCSKFEEEIKIPIGSSVDIFFYELLIPFFYAQSYFQKYDKFPWGTFSHGALGLIESYLQLRGGQEKKLAKACIFELKKYAQGKECIRLLNKKKIKEYWPCLCDSISIKKFCLCHPKVLLGLRTLRKDIRKYNLRKELIA